ncbi:hypothetical protein ACGK9R_05775 [Halomonas sp. HNIBRBA4712]|uniref:hypothetical protein n=1 Tax=Halomonas sp. HNIBRBA4712 TaxID=3373087 RepID=UPI0037469E22
MSHREKCAKCGQEYDPSKDEGNPENPENCDTCGADIKPEQRRGKHHHSSFLVDDEDSEEGQHSLEKTLREASHKADTHDR